MVNRAHTFWSSPLTSYLSGTPKYNFSIRLGVLSCRTSSRLNFFARRTPSSQSLSNSCLSSPQKPSSQMQYFAAKNRYLTASPKCPVSISNRDIFSYALIALTARPRLMRPYDLYSS